MLNRLFVAGMILATALIFSACCKKRNYCTPDSLKVYFTGFDRASTRSVMLKKYAIPDKQRLHTLDSSQFIYNGSEPIVAGKKDTVFFGDYVSISGELTGIYPGYEWVLTLPGSGNYYSISTLSDDDHRYEIVSCRDNTSKCSLAVTHYSINGAYRDGGTAYLSK